MTKAEHAALLRECEKTLKFNGAPGKSGGVSRKRSSVCKVGGVQRKRGYSGMSGSERDACVGILERANNVLEDAVRIIKDLCAVVFGENNGVSEGVLGKISGDVRKGARASVRVKEAWRM